MGAELLTSRARVLACIASNTTISYDEIAEQAHVGRRQVPRIVRDLTTAGYISHVRPNQRNRYTVHVDAEIVDKLIDTSVGRLLNAFGPAQ